MNHEPIWITGATRSGKTTRLITEFGNWWQLRSTSLNPANPAFLSQTAVVRSTAPPQKDTLPGVLVFAANGDNRMDLADRLTRATQGKYGFYSTTPLGFFQDEVMLFWPLLIQQLDLKAQFPLRLAPETEQELATQLWQPELDKVIAQATGVGNAQPFYGNEARLVRRVLDLLQLATLAGIAIADIPMILEQGLGERSREMPIPYGDVGVLLQRWQTWCLERGLLTYSLIAALYWQWLLPNPAYQQHLARRYQMVLADDLDEYPAIARPLFEVLLDAGAAAVFTYNSDGAIRLGLGADPAHLAGLASRCRITALAERPVHCLGNDLSESVVQVVTDPMFFASLPESFQVIQTTSRAGLLRRIAETIIAAVQTQQVQPQDVAVIGPGLDAIARYSLMEMLTGHQIFVESLNDQRPLTSSPIIRTLLTLLALVYPSLGRLVDRDAVAEMLVVLSQESIDPVRAGLLADYCFAPHPDRPRLLPVKTFPRWDRLGYQVSAAYEDIVKWLETQQLQLEQRLIPNPISLLDRAIQHFLMGGSSLPFDQLAALRQLIETAQHYWEVSNRLRRGDSLRDGKAEHYDTPASMTVGRFIQLLRSGTVTANPYPVRPLGSASNAVTLATVFQYRSSRRAHRWQFWLDAGSERWLTGVDALFAAPLFLHSWSGRVWTAANTIEANERRLRRILLDLLGRTGERVFLCHSDLATSGQEQTGVLLSLVNAATSQ